MSGDDRDQILWPPMGELRPYSDPVERTGRQIELADAGLRLVAGEGMGSVTFRAVAAESGWSRTAQLASSSSRSSFARSCVDVPTHDGEVGNVVANVPHSPCAGPMGNSIPAIRTILRTILNSDRGQEEGN